MIISETFLGTFVVAFYRISRIINFFTTPIDNLQMNFFAFIIIMKNYYWFQQNDEAT